jgi:predicted RNase H-like nuclease (RuvC/YqgF family)
MTLIIATTFYDWLPGIISSVFGGSIVAGIVALYKVKPEAGQIVVTAAQGALIVQTGVIDNLKKEVQRLNDEIENLKKENEDLRDKLSAILDSQKKH